jgi:hypothetical protein
MKVLVCGARDWTQEEAVFGFLAAQHAIAPMSELIHGGAPGVDSIAGKWARLNDIPVREFPADWQAHGRAAGPMRNQLMIEASPDLVIALFGRRGTADTVRRAKKRKIAVIEFWRR